MLITLAEYKEQLKELYDPDELVDILSISSEDLIDMFPEKVVEKFELEYDRIEPCSREDE